MSVWHREEDGTYVAEMSEFSRNPVHPVNGEIDGIIHRLVPHVVNEEIVWWYGTLEDGARVLIYND